MTPRQGSCFSHRRSTDLARHAPQRASVYRWRLVGQIKFLMFGAASQMASPKRLLKQAHAASSMTLLHEFAAHNFTGSLDVRPAQVDGLFLVSNRKVAETDTSRTNWSNYS